MNNSTEIQKNSNKILFRNSPGKQKNNDICKRQKREPILGNFFFVETFLTSSRKTSRKWSRTQLDLMKSMTQRLKNEDFNETSFNKINFN